MLLPPRWFPGSALTLPAVLLMSSLLASCDSRSDSPSTTGPESLSSPSGRVTLSVGLGPVGVLARAVSMDPTRLLVALRSDASDSVFDTLALSGSGLVAKEYSLPSQRNWTLDVTGLDQRDSVLYRGSEVFRVLPQRTTNVSLSLDARFSSLKVRFPVLDSLTRFVVEVDGQVWGDSSVAKQTRVGDTVAMDRDYLSADPTGVDHSIGIRVYGQPWDLDTLLYSLDTTLAVVSGNSQGHALRLRWVGPRLPPAGMASFSVLLGTVGIVEVDVSYEDTSLVTYSKGDFGIPWNSAITYGLLQDDRDGQIYRTVQIGSQTWMAENLNYAVDSSWWYDNSPDSGAKYGRLYTWESARNGQSASSGDQVRGVCPSGWHIPSDAEWADVLAVVAGTSGNLQEALYLKSTAGWAPYGSASGNGNDAFGFRVLPSGSRRVTGEFSESPLYANLWSSSSADSVEGWYRYFGHNGPNVVRNSYSKSTAFALRCVEN
ncbi:MAG: fibrobacter succinogenes major paralogous domain-containing protein [Fibrobacteria bacterium]|nr:fibrobacter succinogenes major paralogous domain-containing protein [Fibrobacteria bacterium]